jgi:hypothetical protein
MTSRTILILLLAICGVAGVARAQSEIQMPFSSTETLFERVNGSVCTIVAIDEGNNVLRRASGFILKDSRLLVTNAHVLAGFEQAEVKCGNKSAKVERITNYDGEVDLVLAETGELDVEGLELSTTTKIRPGTQVYAFGSPYGLEGTITPGLTSAYREIEGQTYIQISTPVSPGSSGGPITDNRGAVIGVSVATLEVAQNINFALPASAVRELPSVDLQLSDLNFRGREAQAQPQEKFEPPTLPESAIASGRAEFRGHAFGSSCGEIAISEYERKLHWSQKKGLTRFSKTYSGQLEFDVILLGAPATVIYTCNERFGTVGGHYEISGHQDTVAQIESELSKKYGAGISNPISEMEARKLGCLFNFSLPGSRFYRPSKRTTWNVDERLRIDMLICGGKSKTTFVFYGDPTLADVVDKAEQQASLHGL